MSEKLDAAYYQYLRDKAAVAVLPMVFAKYPDHIYGAEHYANMAYEARELADTLISHLRKSPAPWS